MKSIRPLYALSFVAILSVSGCGPANDIGTIRSMLTWNATPYRDNTGRLYPIRVADAAGNPFTDDANVGPLPPELPLPISGCDWPDSYFSDEDVEPPIAIHVCRCIAVRDGGGGGIGVAPTNTIPTSVYFRDTPYDSGTPVSAGYILCYERIGQGCLQNNRTKVVTCR